MGAINGTSSAALTPFSIGQAIRAKRVEKGLTQSDLAASLGVDRSSVSRMEGGKAMPTIATLVRVASVLEVEIEDLLVLARMFEAVR
jgi:transcriptional regulator with XRE-family HTH domain